MHAAAQTAKTNYMDTANGGRRTRRRNATHNENLMALCEKRIEERSPSNETSRLRRCFNRVFRVSGNLKITRLTLRINN